MPTFHLIADSGSTKTDWALVSSLDASTPLLSFRTPGINPFMLSDEDILTILTDEVVPRLNAFDGFTNHADKISSAGMAIRFYGAGQRGSQIARTSRLLAAVWPEADIEVESDIVCAARALFGEGQGIACILGTGANSCLWDGTAVVRQTPALGFILGDEGSGAVLGRLFLNAIYKGVLPEALRKEFEAEYGLGVTDIIEKVYRQPMPNRWLASLSPFVLRHVSDEGVRSIVYDNFMAFLSRNIQPYRRPELPVNFVGSIAFCYREVLCDAIRASGLRCGKIMKSPLGV